VNDLVIRKTCGGPKRFRPKTREELQNQLAAAERKLARAHARLKEGEGASGKRRGTGVTNETILQAEAMLAAASKHSQPEQDSMSTTVDMREHAQVVDELEELRVAVRSRDAAMQLQLEEVDRLTSECRRLRACEEKLAEKERRSRELKRRYAEGEERLAQSTGAQEAALAEVEHLKAQLELRNDEHKMETSRLREQMLELANESNHLMQREMDLRAELDKAQLLHMADHREKHHEVRAAQASLTVAQESLKEAERRAKRLQDTNDHLTSEVQKLSKEASSTEAFRQRVRQLTNENKDLTRKAADLRSSISMTKAAAAAERDPALHVSQSSQEVECAKASAVAAALKGKEAELALLRSQLEAAEAKSSALQAKEAQLIALRSEVSAARAHAEEQAHLAAKAEDEASKLRDTISSLEREITAPAQPEKPQQQGDATAPASQPTHLLTEIDELKTDLAAAEVDCEGANARADVLEESVRDLRKEANSWKQRYEESQSKLTQALAGSVGSGGAEAISAALEESKALASEAQERHRIAAEQLDKERLALQEARGDVLEQSKYIATLETRLKSLGYTPVGMAGGPAEAVAPAEESGGRDSDLDIELSDDSEEEQGGDGQ
jgi:myosin heavy subunit